MTRWLSPVLLVSAALLGGCGSSRSEQAPAEGPTQLLRVYDTSAKKLTDLRLRVPIQRGWSGAVTKDPKTAIGGTSREIDDSCSLLIQFLTGDAAGPIGVPGVRQFEHGDRATTLDGRRLTAVFRLYRADRGLVFSGGATGPGGALLLLLRDADTGKVVARLIGLGGMDGLKCPFGAEEAIQRTTDALRDVARTTTIERVPS